MAEFTVTAERWKVHVTDGFRTEEYDIEGGSFDEARAEAARRWATREAPVVAEPVMTEPEPMMAEPEAARPA